MITMFTKAQLQAVTDAMTDDANDLILGDLWERENACQFNWSDMKPGEWIEFGKWYSGKGAGLRAELAGYLDAFHKGKLFGKAGLRNTPGAEP